MKSFQNFVNIVERTTPGFGKPTGYDPQGEPMYTRRPGPREKGRRATVQKSPKSVTAVKGEIEAAKGFSGVRSGGLDTRATDPKYTSSVRDPRSAKLGGNVWDDPTPARGRPFKSLGKQQSSTFTSVRSKLRSGTQRDWLASLRGPVPSGDDPWKGDDYISGDESRQRMRGNPTEPFGDTGFDPHGSQKGSPQAKPKPKPAQPQTPPKGGPEPVKQSVVSQQAKEFRASQKTVDVAAKPVGTKFAEPIPKPKELPGLSSEPAGPLKPVRKGESQTIRPQKGPGRTGILGAPKAGVLTGAPKIEPVRVRDITPSVTASNRIPATKPAAPTPTPAKPAVAPAGARRGGRVRLRTPRGSVITPRALEAALTKNRQQTALAQQAQNTKAAIQNAKTLKNVARFGSGVAAYLDFQRASQEVRAKGGGDRRADARGALEAGARIIGSGAGFVAGTPLGPAGQVLGATGGGELAVRKAGKAFERIFGQPGDPVTRQSVTSNLGALYRQNVPQRIRSQVSPQATQTLKGVLGKAADLANKGYKGYRKVKKALDLSQGDN